MEWKIGKGGNACSACSREFKHDENYYSRVVVNAPLVERLDYCVACFDGMEMEKKRFFWRTKSSSKSPTRKSVNFDAVRDLFLKMLEVDDPYIKELTYLLGLVLIRKKQFRLHDFVSRGGKDYMAMQQKKGEPLLHIEVPLLEDEKIDALRIQLSGLLDLDHDGSIDVGELKNKMGVPEPEAAPTPPQN